MMNLLWQTELLAHLRGQPMDDKAFVIIDPIDSYSKRSFIDNYSRENRDSFALGSWLPRLRQEKLIIDRLQEVVPLRVIFIDATETNGVRSSLLRLISDVKSKRFLLKSNDFHREVALPSLHVVLFVDALPPACSVSTPSYLLMITTGINGDYVIVEDIAGHPMYTDKRIPLLTNPI